MAKQVQKTQGTQESGLVLPQSVEWEIGGKTYTVPLKSLEFAIDSMVQGWTIRFQRASASDKSESDREASRAKLVQKVLDNTVPEGGGGGPRKSPEDKILSTLLTNWYQARGTKAAEAAKVAKLGYVGMLQAIMSAVNLDPAWADQPQEARLAAASEYAAAEYGRLEDQAKSMGHVAPMMGPKPQG